MRLFVVKYFVGCAIWEVWLLYESLLSIMRSLTPLWKFAVHYEKFDSFMKVWLLYESFLSIMRLLALFWKFAVHYAIFGYQIWDFWLSFMKVGCLLWDCWLSNMRFLAFLYESWLYIMRLLAVQYEIFGSLLWHLTVHCEIFCFPLWKLAVHMIIGCPLWVLWLSKITFFFVQCGFIRYTILDYSLYFMGWWLFFMMLFSLPYEIDGCPIWDFAVAYEIEGYTLLCRLMVIRYETFRSGVWD